MFMTFLLGYDVDAQNNDRPNLIVILVDDTSYNDFNLMPNLFGKKKGNPHNELFQSYDQTVVMSDYRFIILDGFGYRLYDLDIDLRERYDISAKNPSLIKEMDTKIRNWESTLTIPLWDDKNGW